jgi:hypothetical protein
VEGCGQGTSISIGNSREGRIEGSPGSREEGRGTASLEGCLMQEGAKEGFVGQLEGRPPEEEGGRGQ